MTDHDRDSRWIQTATGRRFWPLSPRIEDVNVFDIAHALSNKCRYSGHTAHFYSVAQHSVLVAAFLPPELKLWGLMHDAAEAYLPDVANPIKSSIVGFQEIEDRVMRVVADYAGLPWPCPPEVTDIDRRIVHDERLALLPRTSDVWPSDSLKPLGIRIRLLDPFAARMQWIEEWISLTGRQP